MLSKAGLHEIADAQNFGTQTGTCTTGAVTGGAGNGNKPKGMYWDTQDRLKRDHHELKQVSFYDIGRKLDFLDELLEG